MPVKNLRPQLCFIFCIFISGHGLRDSDVLNARHRGTCVDASAIAYIQGQTPAIAREGDEDTERPSCRSVEQSFCQG